MKERQKGAVHPDSPEWIRKVAGCFGSQTHKFGDNPDDKDCAFALLTLLRTDGVRWPEVRREFKQFLQDLGSGKKHADKQMDRLREHFRPWLRK